MNLDNDSDLNNEISEYLCETKVQDQRLLNQVSYQSSHLIGNCSKNFKTFSNVI